MTTQNRQKSNAKKQKNKLLSILNVNGDYAHDTAFKFYNNTNDSLLHMYIVLKKADNGFCFRFYI